MTAQMTRQDVKNGPRGRQDGPGDLSKGPSDLSSDLCDLSSDLSDGPKWSRFTGHRPTLNGVKGALLSNCPEIRSP